MVLLSSVLGTVAAASGHAVKILPAVSATAAHVATVSRVVSIAAGASAVAGKVVPLVAGASTAAVHAVPAIAAGVHAVPALVAGASATAVHAVPAFVGGAVTAATTAAVGAATLVGPIALAIKAATAVIGVGKIALLPMLIASLAFYNYDLFDPENRPFNVAQVEREYDFIIVGGGSAGSVLANRLTEVADWKVLLLEAGGHETEISDVPILSLYLHKSKLDWKYRTQPQASACQAMQDKRCCWTRGKVLGGSSVLNTMLYIRGNRRDFDQWEAFGNPGWGYEHVLPYFRKSQDQRNPYLARNKRQHGTGGYLTVQDAPYNTPLGVAFVQAGVEMGYDHVDINGEQQTGFAFYQYTMRRGTRCSTAKAFLRPVRLRKNLHVALFSHTTRVLLNKQQRAVGVEFWRDGRTQVAFARREVILAAGAIGTPHILLNSGIGPGEALHDVGVPVRHHLPGVGQNLQDHIAVGGITWRIDQPVGIITSRLVNLNAALRYAVTENGPLTSSVGLETVAFVNTKYANASDDWPDMNFLMTSSAWFSDSSTKVAHGLSDAFFDEMFGDLLGQDTFSIVPMILRPKSRGQIRLNSSNPFEYPLLIHNYLTHPDDVAVMREGVKLAVAMGETQALRRFGARLHDRKLPNCRHLQLYTDEYWECAIRQYTMTIYHYSGTAKMGPAADPMAVVDAQLRVHGLKGLRVIDASVMPTITNGNINAPTIMIAEKGADMIKRDWLRDKWVKWVGARAAKANLL